MNRDRVRNWDEYDAYLFDIDGTLLHCLDAVHYFGFCKVLSEIAGRPLNLDGVIAHGNTDIGSLRDALELARVPETIWRPQLASMRQTLCQYVEEHAPEFRITVLPGVREVLARLHGCGAIIGVATGNLERVGWAKLEACGLREAFTFGAFSGSAESRAEVFASGRMLARSAARGPDASVCVVGDTPSDVYAAQENQLDVIAVATGIYSRDELGAAGPTLLVDSLDELLGTRPSE